jgi:hypothetical protein
MKKSCQKLCTKKVPAVNRLHRNSPPATMLRRMPKSAQRAIGIASAV